MATRRIELMLCTGTGCVAGGAFRIKEVLEKEIKKHNLQNEVSVVITGCNGFCGQGPIIIVKPENIFYGFLNENEMAYLVEEHLLKGRPVKKFMFTPPEKKEPIKLLHEIPFFQKQMLVVLRNKGIIDPEKIDEYIARDGYSALEKVLTTMKPEEVVEEVKKSGLRGRGGAGFPAGQKWEVCFKQKVKPKYLICNCDEGDPGAYMDRSVFETDPHSVIEGMIIASYACGIDKAFIYIRTEYPLAVARAAKAIEQAKEYGLLGENILGTNFSLDIEIREGSGAFVCGEETALIASVEGKIGTPRQRPPYPVEKGLWNQPTVVNNVETLANVPVIISRGADWYASIGTEKSKGTKIFSLVGKVNNTGLVEVPMGITLREMIFDIGGGIPKNKKFKAVQTGGPSGGCIPAQYLDLPVDFESLTGVGSIMGSGGMIVMDEETCMVDVAKFFIQFTNDESCGKCTICREGSGALLEVLTRITEGKGKEGDIEYLEELSAAIIDGSLCGLGKSLPYPVLTTIKYFREEYEAHIKDKACPARSCKSLIKYYISPDKCVGCLLCMKNCPTNAISGKTKFIHTINYDLCTKCGNCYDVCPEKISAVQKLTGAEVEKVVYLKEPIAVAEWKAKKQEEGKND